MSLLGAPAYAVGAVGAAGSLGAGWLWAKFAATSAQAKFQRAKDEYEALDEARRATFVDRLIRESMEESHSQVRAVVARGADGLIVDRQQAVDDIHLYCFSA